MFSLLHVLRLAFPQHHKPVFTSKVLHSFLQVKFNVFLLQFLRENVGMTRVHLQYDTSLGPELGAGQVQDGEDHVQALSSTVQSSQVLVQSDLRRELGEVLPEDVGRVGEDQVVRLLQTLQDLVLPDPAWDEDDPVLHAQQGGVVPGELKSSFGSLNTGNAGHPTPGLLQYGEADGPSAGSDFHQVEALLLGQVIQDESDELLGLGARYEDRRPAEDGDVVEVPVADEVLYRDVGHPTLDQGGQLGRLGLCEVGGRVGGPVSGQDGGGRWSGGEALADQVLGREPGLRDLGLLQLPGEVGDQVGD